MPRRPRELQPAALLEVLEQVGRGALGELRLRRELQRGGGGNGEARVGRRDDRLDLD